MSKRERTRQYIIEQAALLFNTKGYAGTSLSDIMDATGLKKGGIYGNFEGGKLEIAAEAFEYSVQQVTEQVRSHTTQTTRPHEKLLAAVAFYRQYLLQPPVEGGCPILNTAPEADDTNPLLQEHVKKALDNWRNAIIRVLERGIAAHEIRPEVNSHEFAVVFIAMLEGGIMVARAYNNDYYLHQVLNRLERMIREELVEQEEPNFVTD